MIPLGEKVMAYNGFEHDVSYLKNCSYKKASAVGAAKYFLQNIWVNCKFFDPHIDIIVKNGKKTVTTVSFPFFLRVNCEKYTKNRF